MGMIEYKRIGWDMPLEDVSTGVRGGHGGADDILVEHLFKMMTEDAPTLTSVEDGLNAAMVCFALQNAMEREKILNMDSYWAQLDYLGD